MQEKDAFDNKLKHLELLRLYNPHNNHAISIELAALFGGSSENLYQYALYMEESLQNETVDGQSKHKYDCVINLYLKLIKWDDPFVQTSID